MVCLEILERLAIVDYWDCQVIPVILDRQVLRDFPDHKETLAPLDFQESLEEMD